MRAGARKRVGLFGATGFIGRGVAERLEDSGLEVVRCSRRAGGMSEAWRSSEGDLDLEGLGAVVNLAGESVAQRWTAPVRERCRESRVGLTERIVAAMGAMGAEERPRSLLNASAVGYYGSNGDEILDEESSAGEGYLAELCVEWEQAAGWSGW